MTKLLFYSFYNYYYDKWQQRDSDPQPRTLI